MTRNPLYWGIGLVVLALVAGGLATAYWPAAEGDWDWHWGMMGWPGTGGWAGGPMMFLGSLFMVAFWIGVILVGVWAVRTVLGTTTARSGGDRSPLDIARARYARGDISKEEFEEIRDVLQ